MLNKYNDEIYIFLKEKLSNLTNILIVYYDEINSTFSYLKNELEGTKLKVSKIKAKIVDKSLPKNVR